MTEELLSNFHFRMELRMRWSDMDEMRHVNNAVFLTYLEDARGRYLYEACKWDWTRDGIILANVNLDYLKPLYFTDMAFVYARISKIGTKSFEMEYIIARESENVRELVARAKTIQVMFDYRTKSSVEVPDAIRDRLNEFENTKHMITI